MPTKPEPLNLGVPVVNFPRANAIVARAQALLWVRDWRVPGGVPGVPGGVPGVPGRVPGVPGVPGRVPGVPGGVPGVPGGVPAFTDTLNHPTLQRNFCQTKTSHHPTDYN